MAAGCSTKLAECMALGVAFYERYNGSHPSSVLYKYTCAILCNAGNLHVYF
jgi:hypothetical protein